MTSAVIYQNCNLAYAEQYGSKIYNNESDEFLGNRWPYFNMMSSLVPLKSLSYNSNNNNNNNNNNNINQENL